MDQTIRMFANWRNEVNQLRAKAEAEKPETAIPEPQVNHNPAPDSQSCA